MLNNFTHPKCQALRNLLLHQSSYKYDLSFADFADQELQYLITLYLQDTLELDLSYNHIRLRFTIDPAPIQWKTLQSLNLNNNFISGQTVKLLLKISMAQLTTLSLSNNELTDGSLKLLSKNQWKKLSVLNLIHNKITNKGMSSLARFNCKDLKVIFLQQNWIGYEGKKIILTCGWPKLKSLNCYHQFVSYNASGTSSAENRTLEKMFLNKFREDCEVNI